MDDSCVCCSGKPFSECCERFLTGNEVAKTPEQLMRSRYAAYALGGYGQYLLETWFPATAEGLSAIELSEKTIDWRELEVISKDQQGDKGEVEFMAHHIGNNGEQAFHYERSEFRRIDGRWFYVGKIVEDFQ